MSIFADQVSMPTFGMTQYSGDWRSKARANIAARENAMLQQMAAATDPQTQIDTGMAQLSSFFNPETEEVSDIDKLVNVLSAVNQGADPTTVAAIDAVQSAGESDIADREAREPGFFDEFTPKDDATGEYTDQSVGEAAVNQALVAAAIPGIATLPSDIKAGSKRLATKIPGLKDTKFADAGAKGLTSKLQDFVNSPAAKKQIAKKLLTRAALLGTGPVGIAILVGEGAYLAAKSGLMGEGAAQAIQTAEGKVGGALRNVGGGIMDMFRGDDNFEIGSNTKKAHGGRVHKFSGGIMSAAGMAFPQFINQIANPVQNPVQNQIYTPPPPPATMLPYTPFMTPEYAAQYYSQSFAGNPATPTITPAVMPTSTGTTTSDPGNIASNVGSPVGAGAVGYGSPAAPIFAQPQRGGEGNPNANATTVDAFGNTVPANSTAYGIDPATGNLVASFVPSHTTMISVGDPAPAPLQTAYDMYNMIPSATRLATSLLSSVFSPAEAAEAAEAATSSGTTTPTDRDVNMGAGPTSTPSVSASPTSTQGRSPFSGSSTMNSSMSVGYGPGQVDPGLAAALSGRPAATISNAPMSGISPGQSRAMIGNTSLAGMSPAQAREAISTQGRSPFSGSSTVNRSPSAPTSSAPPGSTQGRSPRGAVGYGAPGNFGAANAAAQAMGYAGAVGNTNPNTGVRSAVTDKQGNPIGFGKKSSTASKSSKPSTSTQGRSRRGGTTSSRSSSPTSSTQGRSRRGLSLIHI